MRKPTNTPQPRARDSIFAYSAWVRHLSPVLANAPNYDDSPQRFDRKTRSSLDVQAVLLSLLLSRATLASLNIAASQTLGLFPVSSSTC